MSGQPLQLGRRSPTYARRPSGGPVFLRGASNCSILEARFDMKTQAIITKRKESMDMQAFRLQQEEDALFEKSRAYLFTTDDIHEETASRVNLTTDGFSGIQDLECEGNQRLNYTKMAPPGSASGRGTSATKLIQKAKLMNGFGSSLNNSLNASDGLSSERQRGGTPSSARGKRPQSTSDSGGPPGIGRQETTLEEEEDKKPDFEGDLHGYVKGTLEEVSRQRLRALQMALRRCGGSNIDSRITQKELANSLQESGIKFPARVYQLLLDTFTDSKGVNFERLYNVLVAAHNKTGRDSVRARNARNDLKTTSSQMSVEERDTDLLRRLEEQIGNCEDAFDLNDLRAACQRKDQNKMGKIPRNELMPVCASVRIPIYGALLSSVLRRCDDENDGMVSWPELMSFLEKAMESWVSHNPDKPIPGTNRPKLNMGALVAAASFSAVGMHQSQSSSTVASVPDTPVTPSDPVVIITSTTLPNVPSTSRADTLSTDVQTPPARDVLPLSLTSQASKPKEEDGGSINSKLGHKTLNNTISEVNFNFEQDFRKSVGTTKNAAGFLNSMKSLVGGKKAEDAMPLMEMSDSDNSSGLTVEANQAPPISETMTDKSMSAEKANQLQEIDINGKQMRFWIPSEYMNKTINTDPPRERIQLSWVYGYRGNDCRNNIHVLASGELVYFIGHVAVLYNREQHFQRHYREHTEDIKCITVHSNGTTIASGQQSSKTREEGHPIAHIRVWRADTLQTVHVLGMGAFHKSIACIGFARTKDRVIAVDTGDDHVMTVWDTCTGKELAKTALEAETICAAEFNPKNPDIIVTIGKEHLVWWKLYPDNNAIEMHMKADYEKHLRARYITCLMHHDRGDLITGDSNGTIYVWLNGGNTIGNLVKHAHDGPVFCMALVRGVLLSGGRDNTIHSWAWNRNMDSLGSTNVASSEGGVRMLTYHKDSVIIGTTMNSMLIADLPPEGTSLQGISINALPLTQGHYDDLCSIIPVECESRGIFLSAGNDGIICMFDSSSRQCVWKDVIKNSRVTCCDVGANASLIVLGQRDGGISFLEKSYVDTREVGKLTCGKDRLTQLKLSPDCKWVAAGSQNGCVYVIKMQGAEGGVGGAWRQVGICKGQNQSITGLDWSRDLFNGCYIIRTSSSAPEFCLWNPTSCSRIEDTEEVKDIEWATHTCKLGYHVAGMWCSKRAKESTINAAAVNGRKTILAMGDSRGYITVFRYPCSKEGAYCHTYKSHAQVINMMFTNNSQYMITCGGKDTLIMQWKIL